MGSDAAVPSLDVGGPLSSRRLGLVGQVAASWGLAGGLLAAVVVTLHTLAGNVSSSFGFVTTTVSFVAGSLIGYLHGGIFAYLGRPPEVDRKTAIRRLALAAVYAIPTMLGGWLVAMVLAMSAASYLAGRPGVMALSMVGWIVTLGVAAWAVAETRAALSHLVLRWPAARALLAAMALAFLALVPLFLATRPEVWVVHVRPTGTTAVFMALVAAVWILGPLGALLILGRRAWLRHHEHAGEGAARE